MFKLYPWEKDFVPAALQHEVKEFGAPRWRALDEDQREKLKEICFF